MVPAVCAIAYRRRKVSHSGQGCAADAPAFVGRPGLLVTGSTQPAAAGEAWQQQLQTSA